MKLLDALCIRGLAKDEREARGLIMAGRVSVAGVRREKPSYQVDQGDDIAVKADKKYVSRGGLKLERAIEVFGLDLNRLRCVDVGSSTGGFTDCMLKHGAAHVYAVDVGYGLLDWALRSDERVTVLERVNARTLNPSMLDGTCDFASVDVSFISLKLIFPALRACMEGQGRMVALVKPQFEAEKAQVGRGGIVREPGVRGEVLRRVAGYARESGLRPLGTTPSPIKGMDGNVEFLMLLSVEK